MSDCPSCGHSFISHNSGVCTVTSQQGRDGFVDYRPGGCACRDLVPDRACNACGNLFFCGHPEHDPHPCLPCHERAFADEVDRRFSPLTMALSAHGIKAEEPWNTGGHVMCLPVHLPVVTIGGEQHQPYLLFSDDAEVAGCGLYLGSDSQGINLEPSFWTDYMEGDYGLPPEGWATRDLSERIGSWLAALMPTLTDWMGDLKWDVTHGSTSWGPYTTVMPTAYTLPTLPDTSLMDFDAE